jgi:hypothetical protein
MEMTREPNGKGKSEPPIVPGDTDPKATDWSAGATAKAFPIGRVSSMAERQRDREPTPASGGASFSVSIESLFKLVGYALLLGGMWWTLRSDLRDMKTTMEFQTRIDSERWQTQVKSNEGRDREIRMLSLTVGDIEKALIRAGIEVEGAEVRIHGRPQGGNGR